MKYPDANAKNAPLSSPRRPLALNHDDVNSHVYPVFSWLDLTCDQTMIFFSFLDPSTLAADTSKYIQGFGLGLMHK